MHRGPSSDFRRAPGPPPRYGSPAALGAAASFPGPFSGPSFPRHFPNLVSYPTAVPSAGFQSFSSEPPFQVTLTHTQGWAIFPTARYDNRTTRYRGLRCTARWTYRPSDWSVPSASHRSGVFIPVYRQTRLSDRRVYAVLSYSHCTCLIATL